MIRIFKLAAVYATIGLFYARYKLNMQAIDPAVMQGLGSMNMPEERCAQLFKLIELVSEENRRGQVNPSLDDILDTMILAITSRPPIDESLIDKLGSFLKHPFGINLVGDKLIKQLRKALLSSADYDVLVELMSHQERRCSCGHTFQHGEGVYFSAAGPVQLLCMRCSLPSYSSCMSCQDGIVPMSQNARNAIASSKHICEECKEKKAEQARAGQPGLQDRLRPMPPRAPEVARGAVRVPPAAVVWDAEGPNLPPPPNPEGLQWIINNFDPEPR